MEHANDGALFETYVVAREHCGSAKMLWEMLSACNRDRNDVERPMEHTATSESCLALRTLLHTGSCIDFIVQKP